MDMTNLGYLERHVPIQYMGKWPIYGHVERMRPCMGKCFDTDRNQSLTSVAESPFTEPS